MRNAEPTARPCRYVLRQCDKLQSGRCSLMDLVFASEVRLGSYKSEETAPAGAQLARRRQQLDPNDKVQTGERVPYVVISRQESSRLRDSAQRPEVLLFPPPLVGGIAYWTPVRPDANFYIQHRILPMLARIFGLIGVDVALWYKQDMRRSRRAPLDRALPSDGRGGSRGHAVTIVGYFESSHCILCDRQCTELLCAECSGRSPADASSAAAGVGAAAGALTATVALTTRVRRCRARTRPCPPRCPARCLDLSGLLLERHRISRCVCNSALITRRSGHLALARRCACSSGACSASCSTASAARRRTTGRSSAATWTARICTAGSSSRGSMPPPLSICGWRRRGQRLPLDPRANPATLRTWTGSVPKELVGYPVAAAIDLH